MKHNYRITLIIGLLFVAGYLQAQMKTQIPDTLNLNEILITGKKATTIRQSNIVGKVLELQNPHDGGEIFKNQPGFGILKKGNYGMEPVLRAFKFGQLNVQFDGGVHSTNACPNRMDPAISQISIEDIEKVEVINGPYSVRFGPVFGGIINIISKRPRRSNDHLVSGSANAGYQSNGNNFYSNIFTQVVKEKYDLSVNAGYKNYGNYKSGSGQIIESSFKRTGYTARLGINPSANQRFQLTLRQSFARDVLYAGLPMDADKDNSSILSLDYGMSNISEAVFSLKFKLYGSYVSHLMTNKRRPNYKMVHATTPLNARNFGGRTEIGISIGQGSILYAGFDFQHIGKDGSRTREVFINPCTGVVLPQPKTFIDKVWQNSKKNDLGLFLQYKFTVSKSLDWLAGLRVDQVNYAIDDPAADFSELYNGNIKPKSRLTTDITTSLLWEPGSGITFQWAIARAERTPDLSELFINHLSVGMDAYEYVGNPNLKPEVNYQTDLKIEKKWQHIDAYADLFFSYLNNYISARADTTIPRKFLPCKPPEFTKKFTNIDQVIMTGFETGIKVKFPKHFVYNLGASYTYAQNLSWAEPLSEIPPFSVITSLTYHVEKLTARLNGQMVSSQNRVSHSFNESTTPGFSVFDCYVTYTPLKFLSINASVTNIFNRNYVEHLSRPYKNMSTKSQYFEPGRSFNMGVKLSF